jgi:ABC-type proline/glycine betaine transport system permease subunit
LVLRDKKVVGVSLCVFVRRFTVLAVLPIPLVKTISTVPNMGMFQQPGEVL